MTRDEAYQLLTKYMQNKNLLKHSIAAEVAMKGIYKYLYQGKSSFAEASADTWGITGLLHDIDYEVAQAEGKLDKHGILLFERIPDLIPEPMAHAIKSHNYTATGVNPESDMDWAITIVDGLTGFIVACALVRPNKKISEVTVESVLKKLETPAFSRNVNRDVIKMCEEKLGIPLEKFVEITLTSIQAISDEMGL